jgi:hypothetical protein
MVSLQLGSVLPSCKESETWHKQCSLTVLIPQLRNLGLAEVQTWEATSQRY